MEAFLKKRNDKIIQAIIQKAEKVCPGSLAMVGINGSFMTGDFYEKSDLDLLLLINDDNGWQLGCTFIQDDLKVGHDLYCVKWEGLVKQAEYTNPNISKLMEAKIVYCPDPSSMERLQGLRDQVHNSLIAPFSQEDLEKVKKFLQDAEHSYTEAMIGETLSEVRVQAGYVIYSLECAIAMLNKVYFRFGVKRAYDEFSQMKKKPEHFCEMIESVITATTEESIQISLTKLMKETKKIVREEEEKLAPQKKEASKDNLRATYEEMYSNWRNKMYHAVTLENEHLSFMSMISLTTMLKDLQSEVKLPCFDVLKGFDPKDLRKTAKAYDEIIEEYRKEYDKVGLAVKHYEDIDTFVKEYL